MFSKCFQSTKSRCHRRWKRNGTSLFLVRYSRVVDTLTLISCRVSMATDLSLKLFPCHSIHAARAPPVSKTPDFWEWIIAVWYRSLPCLAIPFLAIWLLFLKSVLLPTFYGEVTQRQVRASLCFFFAHREPLKVPRCDTYVYFWWSGIGIDWLLRPPFLSAPCLPSLPSSLFQNVLL